MLPCAYKQVAFVGWMNSWPCRLQPEIRWMKHTEEAVGILAHCCYNCTEEITATGAGNSGSSQAKGLVDIPPSVWCRICINYKTAHVFLLLKQKWYSFLPRNLVISVGCKPVFFFKSHCHCERCWFHEYTSCKYLAFFYWFFLKNFIFRQMFSKYILLQDWIFFFFGGEDG